MKIQFLKVAKFYSRLYGGGHKLAPHHAILQLPTLEFGHGADTRLSSGTKVGTGSLCAHQFC